MGTIPHCYARDGENYITVPVLRKFLDEHSINDKHIHLRQDFIEAIEEYALNSQDNKLIVLNWLDIILKEGIIDLHINKVNFDMVEENMLSIINLPKIIGRASKVIKYSNICGNGYSDEFELIKCYKSNSKRGRVLSFVLAKNVYVLLSDRTSESLVYPVFVDLYIDDQIIVCRAKSKSNMFVFGDSFDENKTTNIDQEIVKAFNFIRKLTGLRLKFDADNNMYKSHLYNLLEKYTNTPAEIVALMEMHSGEVEKIANVLMNGICNLPPSYEYDVRWDINNLVEKYFSINYDNKSIFTNDRDAYPLKISATDEEESKVEQTSGLEEPLQSKSVFFDNKRMMQKSRICDGVRFMYKRTANKYFQDDFKVVMLTKSKYFLLKFPEFTQEEDILNVFYTFLDA